MKCCLHEQVGGRSCLGEIAGIVETAGDLHFHNGKRIVEPACKDGVARGKPLPHAGYRGVGFLKRRVLHGRSVACGAYSRQTYLLGTAFR